MVRWVTVVVFEKNTPSADAESRLKLAAERLPVVGKVRVPPLLIATAPVTVTLARAVSVPPVRVRAPAPSVLDAVRLPLLTATVPPVTVMAPEEVTVAPPTLM